MAWEVASGLAPGESVTLSSLSLPAGYSVWPGYFAAGTSDVYAYVDSHNPGVSAGAVAESNETNNRAELHGLTRDRAEPGAVGVASSGVLGWGCDPGRSRGSTKIATQYIVILTAGRIQRGYGVLSLRCFTSFNITRTYAVGVLSLRQSGTFHFMCAVFPRVAREKPHTNDRHVPCCRRQKCGVEMRNNATA